MCRSAAFAMMCSFVLLSGCREATAPVATGSDSSLRFGVTSAGGSGGAGEQSGGARSYFLPIHFFRSSDCDGDIVEITGSAHAVVHEQRDGSVVGHTNYQRVTAVGVATGTEYRVVGGDRFYLQAPLDTDVHHRASIRIIKPGSGADLHVDVLYHITVNANGEVVVAIDRLTSECR